MQVKRKVQLHDNMEHELFNWMDEVCTTALSFGVGCHWSELTVSKAAVIGTLLC